MQFRHAAVHAKCRMRCSMPSRWKRGGRPALTARACLFSYNYTPRAGRVARTVSKARQPRSCSFNTARIMSWCRISVSHVREIAIAPHQTRRSATTILSSLPSTVGALHPGTSLRQRTFLTVPSTERVECISSDAAEGLTDFCWLVNVSRSKLISSATSGILDYLY